MRSTLINPAHHPEWCPPHSSEWYTNLESEFGLYGYPWKSKIDSPSAEEIFERKISTYINQKSQVLDVGCGHGEFTSLFEPHLKEIVGIDVRQGFIETANNNNPSKSIRFLTVDANDPLPFSDQYFDLVYTKKGPWLFEEGNSEGYRIIKPGGIVLGLLHRGSDGGLRSLFPGLYSPFPENWLERIQLDSERILSGSNLTDTSIELIEEIEYLSTPEDVLIKKCYGQNEKLKEYVWKECLNTVEEIFYKNAVPKGLKITNYYHIISAKVI